MNEDMKKMLNHLGYWDVNEGAMGDGPETPAGAEPEGGVPVPDVRGGMPAGPDTADAAGPEDGATEPGAGTAGPPDGPDDPDGFAGDDSVVPLSLPDILGRSYLNYAMSVIVARALPDVRDGLKPVHRRILYAMHEAGMTKGSPYKKCATTVGDVLGHYHPHGDASVYDALVRMAQDFSLRYPLIDGHGNFGSMDGDPSGAYRYTESRLERLSDEMLRDIDKDVVDWNDNFDNTRKEPSVMPSRFPNILANGSQGIAVGMACNIPPHNLKEIIDACCLMLDHDAAGEDTTVDQLLEIVHGPDFPTGGTLLGHSWREIYRTGRGRAELEAVYHYETDKKSKKTLIVFTEIPYQVNKGGDSQGSLMNEIVRHVKNTKLDVADVRDESNREGVRVVVELRKTAVPELVLNNLLQHTKLRTSFSAQMLMLVDGRPQMLPLDRILRHYLDYQMEVVRRRTEYEKAKAEKRKFILDGLVVAASNIDDVVRIIRMADDPEAELASRYGLADAQVQAVMGLRLRSLQKLELGKLEDERAEKLAEIARCDALLADPGALRTQVRSELAAIGERYGDARRTGHRDDLGEFTADDLIPDEPCVLMRTDMGYVKRMKPDAFRLQKRGGRGSKVATAGGDCVLDMISASTLSRVLFFTDLGRVYSVRAYRIPDTAKTARGTALAGLLPKLQPDENVTGMMVMESADAGQYIVVGTRNGVVKRTPLSALPENIRASGLALISLDEGDHVCDTVVVSGDDQIVLVTKDGNCASYQADLVRSVGRGARGVRAMKLAPGDSVVALCRRAADTDILIVTENGFAKRIASGEVSVYKSRNVGGSQCIKSADREKVGKVACVLGIEPSVREDATDVVLTCDSGQVIRVPLSSAPSCGRRAKGLRMINRDDEGVRIISAALTARDEPDDGEGGDAADGAAAPAGSGEDA